MFWRFLLVVFLVVLSSESALAQKEIAGTRIEEDEPAASPMPAGYAAIQSPGWERAQLQYVPMGERVVVPLRETVCQYPALRLGCASSSRPSQFVEAAITDVTRNAEDVVRQRLNNPSIWERTVRPDPGEELILVKLLVIYADGPAGSQLAVGPALLDAVAPWVTADGRVGRLGPMGLGVPPPELVSSRIRLGVGTEGWIAGYIPAGAEFAAVLAGHDDLRVLLAGS